MTRTVDEGTEGAAVPAGDTVRETPEPVGSLLAHLNPQQVEAVTHPAGPLLILAGAGSGKTRVITRRIAWLVSENNVPPGGVLAITFTNKAAGEMRSRVQDLLELRGPWISTFHSMSARILRRDIELLPPFSRDFTIYDTDDRNRLIRDLTKAAGYDATHFRPQAIGAWISDRKNSLAGVGPAEEGGGVEEEVFTKVFAAYDEAMRKNNALDFDDLLLKVLELFELHPGVRDGYARRFEHVLVDEYQDTNRVQYLLMRHLAGFHGNLAVCGDPDQSIYAWRGADVRNILDFESDFPGAKVVRLEQNYRSTQNILKAAQAVITNNSQRKEKDLWSAGPEGDLLSVIECGDEDDEAREIAFQIRSLTDAGRSHDQIAIFYRVNFMQRALERALRLTSTPYQIVAGTEFFQRREIKDLVAYLRLMVNPADDEACRRVINVPLRGVGDRSIEVLAQWAASRGVSLLSACQSEEARASVRGRGRAGIAAFAGLMENLAPFAGRSATEAIHAVVEETEYLEWLARSAERDDVDREANVEELVTNAETYDALDSEGGLRGFLQDIALVSDADTFDENDARVSLMTLHTAKGLEFPVVFIAGMEEELLPHARAIQDAWGDEGGSETGVEEERRLCYVGMTRAKERLFLTHAKTRRHFGGEQYCRPSRFLDEIPPSLVDGYTAEEDEADVLGEFAPDGDGQQDLREGDWVEHDHFGRGRVDALVGRGANARATVRFDYHGTKQLLLQYARLTVVRRGGGA
jgi:DNA helicase-2/ATP-dependent DNA helicase PcrA